MEEDRKRKEAEALRANLLKRKAQQRARGERAKASEGSGPAQNGHRDDRSPPESIADAEQHR
jgi:hypothetical protein